MERVRRIQEVPMTTTSTQQSPSAARRVVDLELLALDLTSCTRCVGSLANIEAAVAAVRQVLDVTGTAVQLRKVLVDSEEEAHRHRFVSSPTIRIGARDIAVDTLESRCDSCTDLCGCSEGTSCRVWLYQGAEHTEAPVGLIVEALLRELVGSPQASPLPEESAYEVPENLRGFFAGKATQAAVAVASCCSPAEQASCCEPAEKSSCCREPEPAACGCR
jgi:hypothetical protein